MLETVDAPQVGVYARNMQLPPPTTEEEDAFLEAWERSGDHDGIVGAIEAALTERRPRLASRLVQLLHDDDAGDADSPVARARRAAGLLVVTTPTVPGLDEPAWTELEDAFAEFRRRRIRYLRNRRRFSDRDPRGRRR